MTGKKVKDFYRLLRSIDSFTDGQVAVTDWDETSMASLKIRIQPNEGAYEGGRFYFQIEMENFPEEYPHVNCETPIYHPNIDPTSEEYNVCLNLFDEWTPTYGLRDVIQGLLFLMYNPNVEDPLSSYFGEPLSDEEFEANVRASLRGEDVDDFDFPWNYYGNDPDMLAKKPTNENTTNENTTSEEKTENNNVQSETTAEGSEEKTENNNVESETTAEGSEKVEETETATDTNEIVPKDVQVMLEKVSELMVQYPEEDEPESQENTEENKDTNPEEAGDDTCDSESPVEQNNVDANVTQAENDDENSDVTDEVPNDTAGNNEAQGTAENTHLLRQNSKCERQCSIKEDLLSAKDVDTNCEMDNGKLCNFAHYLEAFRTCTFVAPDYDHALNIIGAMCCCAFTNCIKETRNKDNNDT